MTVIKRPRKAKVAGFLRAQNLINTKNYDVRRAVVEAGISATTYYKYLEMFGEDVNEAQKLLPITQKTGTAPVVSKSKATDLDRLLQENAALAENIKLRAELSKLMH